MTNPLNVLIGANLRRKRQEKDISQEELAKALTPPVSYQQIQKYEIGTNRISSSTLYYIAKALGCDVLDFYDQAEELMQGKTVTISSARKVPRDDITIMYEKVPQNFRPHIKAILRGLTEKLEMPA